MKLGQLLKELDLADDTTISTAMALSQDTSLPLGRALVLCDVLTEDNLHKVLRCQDALNHSNVGLEDAKKALVHSIHNRCSFEDSIAALGFSQEASKDGVLLGELLLEAGFVTADSLNQAIEKGRATGLPFGRLLVLNGALSESLLASSLNALIFIRDGKLSRVQAVTALQESRKRQISVETHLKEKGFYSLPNRSCPRLGELLLLSGTISQSDLIGCLELSLLNHKPVGEVLVEGNFVTRQIVEAAATVQKLILSGSLNVMDARAVITTIAEGKSIEEALENIGRSKEGAAPESHVPSVFEFLKRMGRLNEDKAVDAFKQVLQNSEIITKVLLLSGAISEETITRAESCRKLLRERKLSPEHCIIAFDYAERLNISVGVALRDLQWYDPSQQNAVAHSKVSSTKPEKGLREAAESDWQEIQNRLKFVAAVGVDDQITEQLRKLLSLAREHFPERIIYCLDSIAAQAAKHGNLDLAEEYYKYSLEQRQKDSDERLLVEGYSNLGKVYYFKKDYSQAEMYCNKHIELVSSILGREHPDVACGWQNLGNVHYAQRKFARAASCYSHGLDICSKALGETHPTTVQMKKNLMITQDYLEKYGAKPQERKVVNNSESDGHNGTISGSWRIVPTDHNTSLYSKEGKSE